LKILLFGTIQYSKVTPGYKENISNWFPIDMNNLFALQSKVSAFHNMLAIMRSRMSRPLGTPIVSVAQFAVVALVGNAGIYWRRL
jgi:hypothetical protein